MVTIKEVIMIVNNKKRITHETNITLPNSDSDEITKHVVSQLLVKTECPLDCLKGEFKCTLRLKFETTSYRLALVDVDIIVYDYIVTLSPLILNPHLTNIVRRILCNMNLIEDLRKVVLEG